MTCKIGINGCGRIGRMALRRALELPEAEVVAVNDLADISDLAYLFTYDSVHGVFPGQVSHTDHSWQINGHTMAYFSEPDPAQVPWHTVGAEVVIEASGRFTTRAATVQHLCGGVQKVLISAPADDSDMTLVPGVNEEQYDPARHHVISMASCTTNSLAPVAKVLQEHFGIEFLYITTIHAYTTSQELLDTPKRKRRRGRAAALSIVPTTTGAAQATGRVLPELAGKMDGIAMRVPIPDGSVTDIVVQLGRQTSAEELNQCFREAAQKPSLQGILTVCEEEIVSIDIVGNAHSAIIDALSTRVLNGNVAKILSWYDNEWGYACRLAELACRLV